MKMHGITINGKHSFDDFRLLLNDFTIGTPSKTKVTAKIPYSSQQFDFSTIMGFQPYGRRTLTFNFNFYDEFSLEQLQSQRIKVLNWLMSSNDDEPILFDLIKDYYFLGEVVAGPDAQTSWEQTGTLKVVIDAHPFKIAKKFEGDDVWDTFNFEEDIAQNVQFDIKNNGLVALYNVGFNPVSPVITVDQPMKIVQDGVTYELAVGDNELDGFMINVGTNEIQVIGTGNIEFKFRREVI